MTSNNFVDARPPFGPIEPSCQGCAKIQGGFCAADVKRNGDGSADVKTSSSERIAGLASPLIPPNRTQCTGSLACPSTMATTSLLQLAGRASPPDLRERPQSRRIRLRRKSPTRPRHVVVQHCSTDVLSAAVTPAAGLLARKALLVGPKSAVS